MEYATELQEIENHLQLNKNDLLPIKNNQRINTIITLIKQSLHHKNYINLITDIHKLEYKMLNFNGRYQLEIITKLNKLMDSQHYHNFLNDINNDKMFNNTQSEYCTSLDYAKEILTFANKYSKDNHTSDERRFGSIKDIKDKLKRIIDNLENSIAQNNINRKRGNYFIQKIQDILNIPNKEQTNENK